jgi:nicotinamide mononucleotide adenylyltransferase
MTESIQLLSQVLPQLAIIAFLCGLIGWSLRGRNSTPPASAKSKPNDSKGADRMRTLEAALEKAKAEKKAVKAELEQLQTSSISVAEFESTKTQLEAARTLNESTTNRINAHEADLKKAQETIRKLNARANEAGKAEKDRRFALENELSKARQELTVLQERPDDTAGLMAEIERLRESVATSTRYAGEMRKREAAALEALEKAQARSDSPDPSTIRPSVSEKTGPAAESSRIAAAKAEVLRILEQNKLKAEEATPSASTDPEISLTPQREPEAVAG